MTAEPTPDDGAAERARRELDAWVEEFLNDPNLEEMLADLRERAATSPGMSNADLAEALGLPAQLGET